MFNDKRRCSGWISPDRKDGAETVCPGDRRLEALTAQSARLDALSAAARAHEL